MSHLIDIYLQPGKVFAALKDKPTFLVPLLLTIVLGVVMVGLYFAQVDGAWLVDRMASANPEATAKEVEQMRKVMPSAQVMGYFGMAGLLVVTVLVTLVIALYYWISGKIAGHALSFRHGLSLTAWSGMPMLLGSIVALAGVITMTPQTTMESLQVFNIDPLFVELPLDHAWSTFAKGFSLLMFWAIGLAALGWRTWFRTGWGQAVFVAALPYIVWFGGLAAVALLK
ncbi:MAG: YIP1 family protein [Lysobacter sp.]|nr:YIP1 family protein [Lysobacter sp.]